jgi:hypothetical protein
MDKLLGLHEPVLVRGEHKCGISEVGCATVPVEVGNEFLGWHSHKLGVEARLKGEVGFVSQRSSSRGSVAALGAGSVAIGSRARGGHSSIVAIA